MSAAKSTNNQEWIKVVTGLATFVGFIFYAGRLDQKVSDIEKRIEKIENKIEAVRLLPNTPLGNNTLFTGANRLEACLLNEEERL